MRFDRGACLPPALGIATVAAMLTSGCVSSPSIAVLGAYFPDWLFCIVAGVVLTIVVYVILKRLRTDHAIGPSALVYPTLVAFLSFAVWLVMFR
ncbi:YtcA family lipoprotein [Paraburkholderia phymatum]|uniref:YtcA family lipoprotein n=1 Tax=Paraburkholderia phymatum TaxID=148447 RepID=UPI0031738B0C